ncbi:hypothetical protein QL285_031980 [Trifolium repens]|nr:hypothetical protein QL285_031980 [Trifolium repens]
MPSTQQLHTQQNKACRNHLKTEIKWSPYLVKHSTNTRSHNTYLLPKTSKVYNQNHNQSILNELNSKTPTTKGFLRKNPSFGYHTKNYRIDQHS